MIGTVRGAARRRLPRRYETDVWDKPFQQELQAILREGQRILDLGAGARPILPPDRRPKGCEYVGLDVSRDELEKAPHGSYDEIVVGDARRHHPELDGRFDLAVSWLAMEHIKPLAPALENLCSYLRPGGALLAQVPGRFSPFSLVNLVLPGKLTRWILGRTQERDPESVFPAYYDRCYHSGLMQLLDGNWSEVEVRPLYTGALYVTFSRVLTAAYIGYEELLYRRNLRNLASFYLVKARAGAPPFLDGSSPHPD